MRLLLSAMILSLSVSAAFAGGEGPVKPQPLEGKGFIEINAKGGAIEFLRDGKPYYIKGVGGQTRIDLAAESGANSTRTWDSGNAKQVLDQAQKLGMTATIGVWLEHNNANYKNDGYKAGIRKKVEALVATAKNHPAMLIYALGNETNSGADTPEAWAFINELAEMIHKLDPNHPTMTVLAGSSTKTINNVAKYAPAIDVLGLNTYGGIVSAPRDAESSAFKGPYVITEWGPIGHWECAKTAWGAPLEQTSAEKQKSYASSYDIITSHKARCVGSYVFLWGQKQERTPTWYGMFLETKGDYKGEALPTVDVMTLAWSGKSPANLAPSISAVRINGKSGIRSFNAVEGASISIGVDASDANNDALTCKFEVMAEATQLGNGGSFEGRPKSLAEAIKVGDGGNATLTAPAKGSYRLFVYVFDGKGKASTLNIPFQVK